MDLHTDPITLRKSADRLSALAGDLVGVADRLSGLAVDRPRSQPDGVTNRCAALVARLRSDAGELLDCEELLRQDQSRVIAHETSVLAQMTDLDRRPRALPEWAR